MRKIPRIGCLRAGPATACRPRWCATTRSPSAACLNDEVGGPSVFPYQPPGLWEEMAFGDGFSMQTYVQSHGDGSVSPQHVHVLEAHLAAGATDDVRCARSREVHCSPHRHEHAAAGAVLLNDPTYLEAARVLAERVLKEAGATPAAPGGSCL